MRRHAELAKSGLLLSRREPANRPNITRIIAEYETHAPRSYVGWAGTRGYMARGHNLSGEHAETKSVCERALAYVTEADREYVMHFLTLDLELAVADAALGHADDALRRIDALLGRYTGQEHRLALGLLHETRASIAWTAGRVNDYERSRAEVERWFLPTREPALIAKCKRLAELRGDSSGPSIPDSPSSDPSAGRAGSVSSTQQLAETVVSKRPQVG
jgi:hypothetical protein